MLLDAAHGDEMDEMDEIGWMVGCWMVMVLVVMVGSKSPLLG